jgi:hypothetical protein
MSMVALGRSGSSVTTNGSAPWTTAVSPGRTSNGVPSATIHALPRSGAMRVSSARSVKRRA